MLIYCYVFWVQSEREFSYKSCNTNLNLIYLKSKMVIEVMIGLSSTQIACAQSYVAIQYLKDTYFDPE